MGLLLIDFVLATLVPTIIAMVGMMAINAMFINTNERANMLHAPMMALTIALIIFALICSLTRTIHYPDAPKDLIIFEKGKLVFELDGPAPNGKHHLTFDPAQNELLIKKDD